MAKTRSAKPRPQRMPETTRWATDIGIDLHKKPHWRIDIILRTIGELPTDVVPRNAAYFSLIVEEDFWWVSVGARDGKEYSYAKFWRGAGQSHELTLDVPKPRFRSIKKWLTGVEAKLGVRFRRDRPFLRSNVKGGAKAVAAWLVDAPPPPPAR